MHKYIAKRLLLMIPVIVGISFIIFSIMSFMPGAEERVAASLCVNLSNMVMPCASFSYVLLRLTQRHRQLSSAPGIKLIIEKIINEMPTITGIIKRSLFAIDSTHIPLLSQTASDFIRPASGITPRRGGTNHHLIRE